MESNILDDLEINDPIVRSDLLPIWIVVFSWIFLIFGLIVPAALILGFLEIEIDLLSLYGLKTENAFSKIGLFITALFGLKTIVSYGLITGKKWAPTIAIADAVIGIIICITTIFQKAYFSLELKVEIIALIPYLIKMVTIKLKWERAALSKN